MSVGGRQCRSAIGWRKLTLKCRSREEDDLQAIRRTRSPITARTPRTKGGKRKEDGGLCTSTICWRARPKVVRRLVERMGREGALLGRKDSSSDEGRPDRVFII